MKAEQRDGAVMVTLNGDGRGAGEKKERKPGEEEGESRRKETRRKQREGEEERERLSFPSSPERPKKPH